MPSTSTTPAKSELAFSSNVLTTPVKELESRDDSFHNGGVIDLNDSGFVNSSQAVVNLEFENSVTAI